jgi:hypothetical protein
MLPFKKVVLVNGRSGLFIFYISGRNQILAEEESRVATNGCSGNF